MWKTPKYVGQSAVLYHPVFSEFLQDCEKDFYVDESLHTNSGFYPKDGFILQGRGEQTTRP
jgi:hypothetical protein